MARGIHLGGFDEAQFGGFGHVVIAFPSLVFQLEVLDENGVGVSVEVGLGLELRGPAIIDLVGQGQLAQPRYRPRW